MTSASITNESSPVEILSHPHPLLRLNAAEVDPTKDTSLKGLVAQMAHAMYAAPGVGLAATQVGVKKRVVVFDIDETLVAILNPVITHRSEEVEIEDEGCLSVPGITIPIERAASIVCDALDLSGRPIRFEGEGLLARVLQHEIDHLDGLLILDRAAPDVRRDALRRYRELQNG